jgi:TIR domain
MTASTGEVPARIFINYRREDTAYPAGWLYDRLSRHFGKSQIFKDIDSIELGDDFGEVITAAVGSCDVLLALIGDRWLTVTTQDGTRRLEDPGDFVRLEIEAALARSVRVIPILINGARMPHANEMPASMAKLAGKQALELSHTRFDADAGRLLRKLDETIIRAGDKNSDHAPENDGRLIDINRRRPSPADVPMNEVNTGSADPTRPGRFPRAAPPVRARRWSLRPILRALPLILVAWATYLIVYYSSSASRSHSAIDRQWNVILGIVLLVVGSAVVLPRLAGVMLRRRRR